MKQVNWGIIGLGTIASKFADAFKSSRNAKLLAISSKNKDIWDWDKLSRNKNITVDIRQIN